MFITVKEQYELEQNKMEHIVVATESQPTVVLSNEISRNNKNNCCMFIM